MLGRALRTAPRPGVRPRRSNLTAGSAASAVSFAQQSSTLAQIWTGGSTWNSPGNVTLTGVTAGNLLISIGGWWDSNHGTGGTQSLPTDTNGTFSAGRNPTLPDFTPAPGWPVHGQIGYIASAASGTHVVTPQDIGLSGDGYFLIAEFGGGSGTWTLIDGGDNTALSGTAGAVDGVTVNTVGTSAQVGDLVIAVSVTDGDPSAIGVGSPTGYANNILTTTTATDNIGVGAAWKIATSAGQQTAAWTWADNDCKLGAALIAVFRRS